MSRPMFQPFVVLSLIGLLSAGCKKKPQPALDVVEVSEPEPEMSPVPVAEIAQVPEHVQQMVQNFQRIHFDFDSDILGQTGRDALLENVEIMQANPQIKVQLQGHADERGTTDYNLALGQKRAESVENWLVTQGVPASRLRTISYGEERPMADGSGEATWQMNRRSEIDAQ